MIVELLEFYSFFATATVRMLMIVATINFLTIFYLVRRSKHYYLSDKSSEMRTSSKIGRKVTAIVPVYHETEENIAATMDSILSQVPTPLEIFAIFDVNDEVAVKTLERYSGKVRCLVSQKHITKRDAVAWGVRQAQGSLILNVDSDTVLSEGCLRRLLESIRDPQVGAVRTSNKISNNQHFAGKYSAAIERGRHVIDSALTPALVVVDGRCGLWRKSAILPILDQYEHDRFLGKRVIIGEDRQLTRLILASGWKTVYNPNAVVTTLAQPTTESLLRQQLRWARSGYLYWFRDIKDGYYSRFPTPWKIQTTTYFLLPFLLCVAVLYDTMVNPIHIAVFSIVGGAILFNIITIPLGLFLWTYYRKEMFGLEISNEDTLVFGLFGFFVMFPLMLFSAVTMGAQGGWLTRGTNGNGIGVHPNYTHFPIARRGLTTWKKAVMVMGVIVALSLFGLLSFLFIVRAY